MIASISAPATAPADGASPSVITVQLSPNVPVASRGIALSTTAGTFALGTSTLTANLTADASGRAATVLYSPTTLGQAVVTATALQNSKQAIITFSRALPDAILVGLSQDSVPDTLKDSVTITAQLVRNIGTVTQNTIVNFTVVDEHTQPFGLFTSVTPTKDGAATAVFSPAAENHLGKATVTVTVPGSTVVGQNTVLVVAPPK